MDYERTQPLPNEHSGTRQMYRCPCGNEIEVDPEKGGTCQDCQRSVPGSVTRVPMSMTMTLTDAERGSVPCLPVDDDDADQLIGQRLGHFEIIQPIGKGGMGQVYRALDTSLQRYVAVKVIRGTNPEQSESKSFVSQEDHRRLMHEAVAQARVNHPNVVTIYYVGQVDEMPFLAMELIDGDDVSQLIRQGEVPYETLCGIAIRVTHALDTASQLGIVHSDIKPQNLLMLTDGTIKLSDFGMARLEGDKENGAVGGTPNYLAPELLKGGKPTIQSDMYALGVTLFEMTFARLPVALSGSSMQEWSDVHESADIKFPDPWPDHLPTGWQRVLIKLLKKEPEQRYESYTELGVELNQILPTKRPPARAMARAIAWFIDMAMIGLVSVPFAFSIQLIAKYFGFGNLGNLVLLPALIGFTVLESIWRQSVGRELVHVKIVNQYSLKPSRKKMILRSILRMQLLWVSCVGAVFAFIPYVDDGLSILSLVFMAADVGYLVVLRKGECLHDRWTRTAAVVGSDRS